MLKFEKYEVIMKKNKSLVFVGVMILVSAGGITALSSTTFAEEAPIPNWIRDTALWWGEGKINDSDFINALQWLMEEEILKVPQTSSSNGEIKHEEINYDKISLEVTGVQELAGISEIQDRLFISNLEFDGMQNVFSIIEQRDQEWISADWDEITPLMHGLIENKFSDILRDHASSYPARMLDVPYDMYPEIILTNAYGANIAQTGKTTDYFQGDEQWWTLAKQNGLFISEVHYDQSADVYSADIVYRVNDNKGGFLGVIKAVTNVDVIYKP